MRAFSGAPLPHLIIAPENNRILAANPAACRLFDVTERKLLQATATSVFGRALAALHVATQFGWYGVAEEIARERGNTDFALVH